MNRFASYEPIPFWFINDDFDKEEIILQLDYMKENAITAFFLHVRDGNIYEGYGTELFFSNVKFIVEQAIKRNIKVWLYDEDSYPSGNLGGKIVLDRPELQACALKVIKIDAASGGIVRQVLGRVKGLYGYIVQNVDGVEKVTVLKECFGTIRRNWYKAEVDRVYCSDLSDLHYKHLRGETNYTEIVFEAEVPKGCEVYAAYLEPVFIDQRFSAMADCLNIETTKEFINNVHEKYKKYVGEYFGKQIPGIFLDEPNVGGILPYTEKLPEKFLNDFGYNAENNYYKLCSEYQGDKAKFRREYVRTCINLFNENFILPIRKWCDKNGLIMTGHYGGEESLFGQMLSGQNIYRNTRTTGLPGYDIITYNIGSHKRPMLLAGANLAVSAATHENNQTVLAECFALLPFDAGYPVLKRTGDWLFVNGINKLVPHAFHYGYSAFQRADAGKSFFFQDEKFDEYLKFAEYAGRCCKLLHDYERKNDILAVIPYSALSEEIPLPTGHTGLKRNVRVEEIENQYFGFIGAAAKVQLGVDCADIQAIYDAKVIDGKVSIGNATYSKVVVFDVGMEENNLLKHLKKKGVDAVSYNSSLEFLQKSKLFNGDTVDLLAYRKKNENGELIFIFNNSERFCNFSVKVDKKAYVYDAEKDEKLLLEVKDEKVSLALNAFESLFLIVSKNSFENIENVYQIPKKKEFNLNDFGNFDLTYKPKGMRMDVENWHLTSQKDGVQTFDGQIKWARLRDVLGTQDDIYKTRYKVPFFDRAPRLDSIYPQKAIFRTEIECVDKSDYILFDKWTFSGEYKMLFNGCEVDKAEFYNKRVYDKSNIAFVPKWKTGKNVIEICFESGQEFEGINGELYVMKNLKNN